MTIAKSAKRLDVQIHDTRFATVTSERLEADVVETFAAVQRAHNAATTMVLSSFSPGSPQPANPIDDMRHRIIQDLREDIRVTTVSPNGMVRAAWFGSGDIRVRIPALPHPKYCAALESDIATALIQLSDEYRSALRDAMQRADLAIQERKERQNK